MASRMVTNTLLVCVVLGLGLIVLKLYHVPSVTEAEGGAREPTTGAAMLGCFRNDRRSSCSWTEIRVTEDGQLATVLVGCYRSDPGAHCQWKPIQVTADGTLRSSHEIK
jgi:hypothetical protein